MPQSIPSPEGTQAPDLGAVSNLYNVGMPWRQMEQLSPSEVAAARLDKKKARFFLDANVDVRMGEWLRNEGFNVVHAHDVRMHTHPDEDILAYAERENRILLTCDEDFLNERHYPSRRSPGIVVLPESGLGDCAWLLRAIGISRELWRSSKVVINADGTWIVHSFEPDIGRIVTTRYRLSAGGLEIWEKDH